MRGRFEGFQAVFLYCPLRARLTKCPMNNSIISFLSFFKWICCLFLLFSPVFLPCLKILMYSVMKLHRLSGPDRGMKGISNKTRMSYSCERLFWYITFRLYWRLYTIGWHDNDVKKFDRLTQLPWSGISRVAFAIKMSQTLFHLTNWKGPH